MGKQAAITSLILSFCLMDICLAASPPNSSTDEHSLLAIKSNIIISDPNNILANNWSVGTDFCTWIGVTCSRRRPRVTVLNLFNMSLQGTIAKEIGNLSFLSNLNIGSNSFNGVIPHEIGDLRSLRWVQMSFNQLSGEIPLSFGLLINLEFLSIQGNHLIGAIPWSIFNISSLRIIAFTENQLSGTLPNDICFNLPKLEGLYLSSNQLSGDIPKNLSACSHFNTLSLSYNNFIGVIPMQMGNLSQLQRLTLGSNKIAGTIPPSIGNLSNLMILELSYNNIHGKIPLGMGLLSNLTYLSLGNNRLNGEIPQSIFNLSRLVTLSLPVNELSGKLPYFINRGLPNLENLYLGDNEFGGKIPNSISNLSNLLALELPLNYFSGNIPITLGNLQNLRTLRLESNQFTNDLSVNEQNFLTSLANCRYLKLVVFAYNPTKGLLPKSIGSGNFSLSLESFLASSCRISGTIPNEVGNLSSLIRLAFGGNELNGIIPPTLGKLKNLQTLDLRENNLQGSIPIISGVIPSTFGQLQSLNALMLSNNKLQGPTPDNFDNLRGFQYLDLSYNNLSGEIPKSLETLTDLIYFNVSFNDLIGEIPEGGPFINFTTDSFIGNEGLCGASRFKVKACKQSKLKSSTKNIFPRHILPPIASIALAAIIVIMFLRYRARNSLLSPSSISPLGLTHERVSYYELLRATNNLDEGNLIGTGSLGSVYKGIFSNGTTIAMKVFNLDVQGALKSFDIECQILSSIRHRNLVKVITSCSNLDFKALVLEYMPNGNLDQWLYSPNYFLSIAQRLRIMIDVASAIEYLHQDYTSPIIHRDLKPGNILLDEDMVACVGDFGIAKLLTQDQRTAQTKTVGTIGYMAPEYGSAGLVSTSVDVYSFGILLIETFTRKKPTDEMFLGQLTLRSWVIESLPNGITKIVDVDLLNVNGENIKAKHEMLLTLIMELALECTTDSPEERLNMKDVLARLKKIKARV